MGKTLLINYIVSQVPFLAGGLPGWLFGVVIGKLTSLLAKQLEFQAYVLQVHIRVYGQETNFIKAVNAHKETPNEQTQYDLINAAKSFIKLNN